MKKYLLSLSLKIHTKTAPPVDMDDMADNSLSATPLTATTKEHQ